MRVGIWLAASVAAALLSVGAAYGTPGRPQAVPAHAGSQEDAVLRLLLGIEAALQAGDPLQFQTLTTADAAPAVARFAVLLRGPRTGAVVRERDRIARDDGTIELLLDIFLERGSLGHISTWRAVARRSGESWLLASTAELSSVDGLYRLALGATAHDAAGLTIVATDFSLRMKSGVVFTVEAGDVVTGLVLRGSGEMVFTPPDPAERRQVEIFSGGPSLQAAFEEAFVRLHPSDLRARLNGGALVARDAPADARRRALEVFADFAHRTYSLDLQDLSRDRWSLVPAYGDFVAEVRTKDHGELTYALSAAESESVSLFQRDTRRNISVYPSEAQLGARGRFYSEDDLADYDVEHFDIDVRATPAREWIEGNAMLRLRVRRPQLSTVTLRLADSLVVRSVAARGHGRLMHLRVVGHNSVVVTLPAPAAEGEAVEMEVRYGGRLSAQAIDRELVSVTQAQEADPVVLLPEPRWIYSNRSYWYPQSPVPDFATSRLRVTVPLPFDVVATGEQPARPQPIAAAPPAPAARTFTFEAARPARYLSFVVSRFQPVVSRAIEGDAPARLNVVATPRQAGRARTVADEAERIFSYYRSILGSAPYPELTLALSESELPGGHSPAYFVLLNQTLPTSTLNWRADPVSFENYPAFFIAHEIAHQWWGQAVGWKNYHEQWLSEGFAQYFATLYAGEQRGPDALTGLVRQMRRWALDKGDEGPIYLGYRLGHIKGDTRVFRSIIYNKAAIVLHMLRRLMGDERFFAGLRRFYAQSMFAKAGTDDLRRVMEEESGRSLERFFERWVHGFGVPVVKVTHRVEESAAGQTDVVIRAEQSGPIYDLPITIRVEQTSRPAREAVLLLTGASAELRMTLDPDGGRLRRVIVDSDGAALARFVR
jgi:hypothetical protein